MNILCKMLCGILLSKNVTQVGIIIPLEHQAMTEIVQSFESKLRELYHKPIEFKVMNAQGDQNLQRSIIEQMHSQNYAMLVPISTGTARMTAAMVHDQPIIAVAADISDTERHSVTPCNVAVVDDEIDDAQIVAFIHTVYPQLKNLALVYSASDKIFPEVAAVKKAAASYGITVDSLMVQNLSELYSTAQAIPQSAQAIFILKDSLIVSGITTLIQTASLHHIPLITSDDGTVGKGASFAVGVSEKQIGEEGAILAAQILQGKSACELPITKMTQPSVFINLHAAGKDAAVIKKAAGRMHICNY